MIILEALELTKCFGSLTAVDHLSVSVERGEIFGLLGRNGAGKSTVIKMLTTLLPPTFGTARIGGFDLVHQAGAVRRIIGYVPQLVSADGTLTGYENLRVFAQLYDITGSAQDDRISAALDFMGLAEARNRLVREYSGGMIRRLEIAQSTLHRPAVLFLDEPTVGLDPLARETVWDHIEQLRAKFQTTILLTTHDMEEADQLCQRIAIMDHGKVLVNDTPEQLKKIIPGGTALELRVRASEGVAAGASAADSTDRVLAALRALPGVTQVDELHASVEAPLTPPAGGPWGGAGAGGAGESGGDAPDERGVSTYRLYAEDVSALIGAAAQAAIAAGAEVRDLRVQRPSLENVFIYLTGRNLR